MQRRARAGGLAARPPATRGVVRGYKSSGSSGGRRAARVAKAPGVAAVRGRATREVVRDDLPNRKAHELNRFKECSAATAPAGRWPQASSPLRPARGYIGRRGDPGDVGATIASSTREPAAPDPYIARASSRAPAAWHQIGSRAAWRERGTRLRRMFTQVRSTLTRHSASSCWGQRRLQEIGLDCLCAALGLAMMLSWRWRRPLLRRCSGGITGGSAESETRRSIQRCSRRGGPKRELVRRDRRRDAPGARAVRPCRSTAQSRGNGQAHAGKRRTERASPPCRPPHGDRGRVQQAWSGTPALTQKSARLVQALGDGRAGARCPLT